MGETKKSGSSKRLARVPRCPGCKNALSWETIKAVENEISLYLRERLYFCPCCGDLLGFSSWHQIQ
jgi:uncharacterized protein with PIN domain